MRSEAMQFSGGDTSPEYIKLAWLKSNNMSVQQKAYLSLAYWAISIANMDKDREYGGKAGFYEVLMKRFVYIFIADLGISPFVKCYNKRSIIQACIASEREDMLRELLSHKYELLNKEAYEIFKSTLKSKDFKGNNVFHDVFMLD